MLLSEREGRALVHAWCGSDGDSFDAYGGEQAFAIGATVQCNAGVVLGGDGFGDEEAETAAGFTAAFATVKAIKNAFAVGDRYAGAVVGYLQHGVTVNTRYTDIDTAMRWCIAHGIVDQVAEQDAQVFFIAANVDMAVAAINWCDHAEIHVFVFRLRCKVGNDTGD